jgi:hypothetical protein
MGDAAVEHLRAQHRQGSDGPLEGSLEDRPI